LKLQSFSQNVARVLQPTATVEMLGIELIRKNRNIEANQSIDLLREAES
jgi:hypothetical protein